VNATGFIVCTSFCFKQRCCPGSPGLEVTTGHGPRNLAKACFRLKHFLQNVRTSSTQTFSHNHWLELNVSPKIEHTSDRARVWGSCKEGTRSPKSLRRRGLGLEAGMRDIPQQTFEMLKQPHESHMKMSFAKQRVCFRNLNDGQSIQCNHGFMSLVYPLHEQQGEQDLRASQVRS
jgi:hypothetical protein